MKTIQTILRLLKMPALFIFFAYVVLSACYNLAGADHFFHTKVGEYITTHKTIPEQDVFSFTMNGKAWVDHEWLYQVLVYKLHHSLGLEGFFVLRIIIFSLIFFLLATMVLRANWLFGFPLLVYGLQLSLSRFTMRPDNLSLLFLAVFLLPFVFKKKKLLFILPFIQLLWVNIHGFFFLGPLVLLVYLIFSRFNKIKEDQLFYNRVKKVFIFSILACFVTPQPIATVSYPFGVIKDILSGNQGLFYKYIQELERPLANIGMHREFFGYIIFTFICLLFFKNTNWFYLILGLLMLGFSLNSLRNMYFFMPVAIAIFVDRFPMIKEVISEKLLRKRGFLLLEICLVIYAVNLCVPMVKKVKNFPKLGQARITSDGKLVKESIFLSRDLIAYPKEMIDFIETQKLPERMFNSFNVGAAMIFNFFPQRQVFIDGRAEVYGREFFSQYRDIITANEEVFDKIVEKYQIEGFVLSYFRNTPPPVIKLLAKKGFECVYFGQKGIIFVSRSFLNNNPKLKAYRVNFGSIALRKPDLLKEVKFEKPHLKGYFNMADILHMLGFNKKSKEYLEEILRIAPSHSESLYLLSLVAYEDKNYSQAFILCRKSLLFNPSDKAHRLLAKIYLKTNNTEGAQKITKSLKIDFVKLKQEAESD